MGYGVTSGENARHRHGEGPRGKTPLAIRKSFFFHFLSLADY